MLPRKHPLFPTLAEIKSDPSLARSDHLCLYMLVPYGGQTLRIATLNVLGPGGASGLHVSNTETLEQAINQRYIPMLGGIKRAHDSKRLDLIFFQEIHPDQLAPEIIKEKLGKDFEVVADEGGVDEGVADKGTLVISCYNSKLFTLVSYRYNSKDRIMTLYLRDNNDTDKFIVASNVWGNYSPSPEDLETVFRRELEHERSEACFKLLVGDLNTRVVPLDNDKRNVASGIIPASNNELNGATADQQITDSPDGGYYIGSDGKIHQITNVNVIDYDTGDFVEDLRSSEEIQVWPEYRMVCCLDHSYLTKKVINDKTIFEYEAELRWDYDQSVVVRVAADSFNNKGIGIRILNDTRLYEHLRSQFSENNGFQFKIVQVENPSNKQLEWSYFVFAKEQHIRQLHVEIVRFKEKILQDQLCSELNADGITITHSSVTTRVKISFPHTSPTFAYETLPYLKECSKSALNIDVSTERKEISICKNSLPILKNQIRECPYTVRNYILNQIDDRIAVLSGDTSPFVKFIKLFLIYIPEKVDAMMTLRQQIYQAKFGTTAQEYHQIITNWEEKKSFKKDGVLVSNRTVIERNRNLMFAPDRKKETETTSMIDRIKSTINPSPQSN